MKITINYDLLERISEAKYGFSLVRTFKSALMIIPVVKSFSLADKANTMNTLDFQKYIDNLPLSILSDLIIVTLGSCAVLGITPLIRTNALANLEELAEDLKALNIDTDESLLLNAYKYHTEYKIDFENKVPTLIQKKYINIPTNDKEVSLMQEHVIGSFSYTLSKKRLNKQTNFKLVFN